MVTVARYKHSLSIVRMAMIYRTFENFVKFRVIPEKKSVGQIAINPMKNAFEISQRQLSRPRLPERTTEKNKKDKLFNILIVYQIVNGSSGLREDKNVLILSSRQFCGILMITMILLQVRIVQFLMFCPFNG